MFTALFVIIVLFIIAALFFSVSQKNYDLPKPVATPDIETYQNFTYDTSLTYNRHWNVRDTTDDNTMPWRWGSTDPGERLLTLEMKTPLQTNLRSVQISIGVSKDPNAVAECTVAQSHENPLLGGPAGLTGFSSIEAGMGNYYELQSYRSVRDGACIALETVVHSTNLANYDPNQGITAYDAASVAGAIQSVINTFQFSQ